jgi:predicted membrane channel-forming protein YqfA (hemolysin III family)
MNTKNGHRVNYHTMIVLTLIAGVLGIAFQFMPDGGLLAFMVSAAALGGLIGGSKDYEERDRRHLGQSYKITFEWLLLAVMAVYAFLLLARFLPFMAGAVIFLNGHWPNLIISIMCLLMGTAGFHRIHSEGSA